MGRRNRIRRLGAQRRRLIWWWERRRFEFSSNRHLVFGIYHDIDTRLSGNAEFFGVEWLSHDYSGCRVGIRNVRLRHGQPDHDHHLHPNRFQRGW